MSFTAEDEPELDDIDDDKEGDDDKERGELDEGVQTKVMKRRMQRVVRHVNSIMIMGATTKAKTMRAMTMRM